MSKSTISTFELFRPGLACDPDTSASRYGGNMETKMAITPRYYLTINGGPKIGWPRTFASRAAALAAAAEANRKDGIAAGVDMVPSDWTISPDGEVAWLIGGPAGLRYQRDVSAPWRSK